MHKDRAHRHYGRVHQPSYPSINPRQVSGKTLTRIVELAEPKKTDVVLDLASGPSYLAVTLAPLVTQAVSTDVTSFSIDETWRLGREKGIANLHVFGCESETLPFRDGTFPVVCSRIAAHHFSDVRKSMHEIARVTNKGGRVIIADTVVPVDDEIDRFINHLDHVHDPTHVRNYTVREWRVLFADAGLKLKHVEEDVCEDDRGECLREWLGRTGASAQTIRQATGLLVAAKAKIKDALMMRAERGEIYFQIRRVILAGEK
ncbi:MAG: methyltransferase domain-containing protein [Candidatus Riflebacteria bacterium]|nr:methyltransferase domain-containing protein [Candidatus Riflebacteria bacterium]